MRKHKPLTAQQLENIREAIARLEAPIALDELAIEVEEYFERNPTADCQDITPRTMAMYLRKFLRLMGRA